MKLSDVLNEQQIDELGTTPMGIGSRIGQGVLAKLGSGKAQAALDVGKRANRFEKAFSGWARRSGLDLENISDIDIDDFLSAHGLPKYDHAGVNVYDLSDSSTARDLWIKVAQKTFRVGGAAPTGKPRLGPQLGMPASNVGQLASQAGSLSKVELGQLISQLRTILKNMP